MSRKAASIRGLEVSAGASMWHDSFESRIIFYSVPLLSVIARGSAIYKSIFCSAIILYIYSIFLYSLENNYLRFYNFKKIHVIL